MGPYYMEDFRSAGEYEEDSWNVLNEPGQHCGQ